MIWVYTLIKKFLRLTLFNFGLGIYLNHFTYLCRKKIMEAQKQRGGWRPNSGRRARGLTTKAMSLKLDLDLYEALSKSELNKNRYINDAVRIAMKKDKLI